MNAIVTVVLVLVIGGLLLVGGFLFWQRGLVRVESGTVGLLVVRGRATSRTLTPGTHWVFPFRQYFIQGYVLRDLTYLATDDGAVEESDYADPAVRAQLGDRAPVTVSYTIRFRLRTEGLLDIHDHLGPDGIKRLVRDESRRIIADELNRATYSIDHAFGSAFDGLEAALRTRIDEALTTAGFELVMFHLRSLDLGPITDVVQATVAARAELERERAAAEVRALRISNEAASAEQLESQLSDLLVRYRQIELGRELLQRWDGRLSVTDAAVRQVAAPGSGPGTGASTAATSAVWTPPAAAPADGAAPSGETQPA